MNTALIGHTGFVGGSLARQTGFTHCYNSKNIEEIQGNAFELLVISGMPAAKWIANGDPAADRAILDRLWGCVSRCVAQQVVVMSTVDVYPKPVEVDEETVIDTAAQQTYGRNRLLLEELVKGHFSNTLVIRLPGLFGPGLRKNALYDLLHNNELHKVNAAGSFQFYNMNRLWDDVRKAQQHQLGLVNFVTEPVTIGEAARAAFGIDFTNDTGTPPARYNIRSRHAQVFGGDHGYCYSREQVLTEMGAWVRSEREGVSA